MNSRRSFLKLSLAALAGTAAANPLLAELAKAKKKPGIQLFTIPSLVSSDFKGTMEKLSGLGYKEIEFFGPYPFSAKETIDGWQPHMGRMGIKQNAFYGYSVKEVRKILNDLGLTMPSAHLDLATFRTNLDAAMEEFSNLGVKYVAVPVVTKPEDRADFNRLADEFSAIGAKTAKHGITFVYHNHGYEHAPKNGVTLMDTLLSQTDKKNVKFELDIFWMSAAGADPVAFLNKYPGRFRLMHVKNASETVRFSGDGSTPMEWYSLMGKMADPPDGVFDVKKIIAAGKKSGVEHFFLERDLAPDPEKTLKNSSAYFSTVL